MPTTTILPTYEIEIWSRAAVNYGYNARVATIARPKNVGWSDYLNDVPEAFFTLYQDDPQAITLRSYIGKAHVRIYRLYAPTAARDLVWCGLLGTEISSHGNDVVFYAHGYLSILYWLHTDWAQSWSVVQLNTIVNDAIIRANAIADSEFKFITTGTVEAPPTTSGGSTPIVLAKYDTFYKRILFVLRELAAISRSDTTNVTFFEVTHALSPTFNFWKNKGVDRDRLWEYGGKSILDYEHLNQPATLRNQALGVGTSPRELTLRSEQSLTPGTTGRRQEAILFQWVRDQTELDRITKLRLLKGNRDYINLRLTMFPGAIPPPGGLSGSLDWLIGDRVTVKLDRGIDSLNSLMLITGAQVLWVNGVEYVRPIVEQRSGI